MDSFNIKEPSFWNEIIANRITPEETVSGLINMDDYCGPWLNKEYSNPSNISNLLNISRYFSPFTKPGYHSFIQFLETVLSDGVQQTDLSIGLQRRNFPLIDPGAAASFFAQFKADPCWFKVFNILQLWLNEESFTSPLLNYFWLEFDIEGGGEASIPNIFFGLKPTGDYMSIATYCMESLGIPADQSGWQNILASLRGKVEMIHIGVMLARHLAPIRIVALGLIPGNEDYLFEMAQNTFVDHNMRQWQKLMPFLDGLSGFSFDVDWHSGEIKPRVGIEYDFGYCKGQPKERHLRLESFLHHLADQELCCWPKAESVLTLPRRYVFRRNGLAASTILHTDLSHIKVDFSPERLPRIKAYEELIMFESQTKILGKELKND